MIVRLDKSYSVSAEEVQVKEVKFYIKTSKVISNVFDYISKVIVIVIITFLQVL